MEHALSFITGRKILSQPTHGIEPWTFSLRMKCSTTELCGHIATRPENTLYKQNTYCQIIQQRQQPMTIAWPRSLSRYHKVALCTTMFTCYVGTCTVRLARYAICKSSGLISISRDPVGILPQHRNFCTTSINANTVSCGTQMMQNTQQICHNRGTG